MLLHYAINYSLHILLAQGMVHREAYDLIGNLSCHRQVLLCGRGIIIVGIKGRDERVEIAAAIDIRGFNHRQEVMDTTKEHYFLLNFHLFVYNNHISTLLLL